MSWNQNRDTSKLVVSELEKSNIRKKRRQAGVEFPSAKRQEQLLIIRLDISQIVLEKGNFSLVREGLKRLCIMFDEMDKGNIKIDNLLSNGDIQLVKLSDFSFTATLGFGSGFFDKLNIKQENRPNNLKEMPSNSDLGDSQAYKLIQTDLVLQLCSTNQDVNRWVFQHFTAKPVIKDKITKSISPRYVIPQTKDDTENIPTEIYSAISDWATIVDMHAGFQRIDGKNLLGFNDGISNPKRLANDVVWTTIDDERQKFTDGTYMVFQKIEHDLDMWRRMSVDEQEKLVGRSKGTGLLLGTLSKEQDQKLGIEMNSDNPFVRERSRKIWKKLYDEQKDPDKKFFDSRQRQYRSIQLQCPVWSHVRKSNPRQSEGAARSLIYRRGYLFVDGGGRGMSSSGLLFICFQRDIEKGFENIKKVFLNNRGNRLTNPLSPGLDAKDDRAVSPKQNSLTSRYSQRDETLRNRNLGESDTGGVEEMSDKSTKINSFESLAGYSEGKIPGTVTLGGGYYFIPPIPNKRISDLSEQFFS